MPCRRFIRFASLRDMAVIQPDVLLPYTSLPNVLCGVVWRIIGARACVWNQRDEGRELPESRWLAAALKNVSRVISNSRQGADFLATHRGVAKERIDLVFNGVELPPPEKETVRPPWPFVAVMLANIHKFKDHATLLHAWKIVCGPLPESMLLLAGAKTTGAR